MPLECKHIGEPGNCRYCQMDAEIAALREKLATVEREAAEARSDSEAWESTARVAVEAKLPCGHPGACGYTHDGGKHIGCLWCDESKATRQQLAEARGLLKDLPALQRAYHDMVIAVDCRGTQRGILVGKDENSKRYQEADEVVQRFTQRVATFLATPASEAAPGSDRRALDNWDAALDALRQPEPGQGEGGAG